MRWVNKRITPLLTIVLIGGLTFIKQSGNGKTTINPDTIENRGNTVHISCPYTTGEYPPRQPRNTPLMKAKAVNVPHHLLARDIIADMLNRISPEYTTVIILGPNHRELGMHPVVVSEGVWNTPFGMIQPDSSLLRTMVDQTMTHVDEDIFSVEHSVCALVSFVKRYFPNAAIAPIVLKGNTSSDTAQKLGELLARECEGCLLITSVDFSHAVSAAQATKNDLLSSHILRTIDIDNGNQIVADSLPTLETLMHYLKNIGVTRGEVVHMSNSNEVSSQNLPTVTSYLTIVYE